MVLVAHIIMSLSVVTVGHIPPLCCSRRDRFWLPVLTGQGSWRMVTGISQHKLAEAKAAVLFSASHRGWSGAETQPCLCNGQHPEILGSYATLQLHPGPQVGK